MINSVEHYLDIACHDAPSKLGWWALKINKKPALLSDGKYVDDWRAIAEFLIAAADMLNTECCDNAQKCG
jgi:hypothetical protein